MQIGDKIVSIKKLYTSSNYILMLDEKELCTIYSLKPTSNTPLSISVFDKDNHTFVFSGAVGNKYYIWDYFITIHELRKEKINKIKERCIKQVIK